VPTLAKHYWLMEYTKGKRSQKQQYSLWLDDTAGQRRRRRGHRCYCLSAKHKAWVAAAKLKWDAMCREKGWTKALEKSD